ncbi:MAG: excinuclease ABC subunit C [Nitrospira bacterium HGW-Nitrospira-1]|nr:MAG: excinuclease ABC subunit C [Nitrospira bacterium HGW-Nitrospira-1]
MPRDPQNSDVPELQKKLASVPEKPGVYLFQDEFHKVLYVGKARELRNRLRSYFQKSYALDPRKSAMMGSVGDFEYTVTGNELEALVLEANLIKQHRPRYNILLRDDKSYPYLKLTLNEKWPRLLVVRRIRKDGARYFGPYVPSGPMWSALSFIRNNFPVRTCKYSLEKRMRPCIQHQIKRCVAPCTGEFDHREYLRIIQDIRLLLEGKNKGLLASLEKKMRRLSEEMRYEDAVLVRDRIRAIQRISETQKAAAQGLGDVDVIGIFRTGNILAVKILFSRNGIMIGFRDFYLKDIAGESDSCLIKNFIEQFYAKEIIPPAEVICPLMPEDAPLLSAWLSEKRGGHVSIATPKRGIKKKLLVMAEENARIHSLSAGDTGKSLALEEIASRLHFQSIPQSIGAFDISNMGGKEAVGAFVYWENGEFKKQLYRHIKMDAVKGPDDYAMMKEMVKRTINNPAGELPDMMIIDGGREHLEAALSVFRENHIKDKYIVGLAKDPDRIFLHGERWPVDLEDGRPSSLLLKKIRDEVHRFAILYHKKLRSRKALESPLEKIYGVGRKRHFALLKHFGSIEAIRRATGEEIAGLKGFNRKIAEDILAALKK